MKLLRHSKYAMTKAELDVLARASVAVLSNPAATDGQRDNARMLDYALRNGSYISVQVLKNFLSNYQQLYRQPVTYLKRQGIAGPAELTEMVPGNENGHGWATGTPERERRANYAVEQIELAVAVLPEEARQYYQNARIDRRVNLVPISRPAPEIAEHGRIIVELQRQIAEQQDQINHLLRLVRVPVAA